MSSVVRWLPILAALALPVGLSAQIPVMLAGFGGVAFPTDENTPGESNGGFSFQGDVGLRLRHISLGAEYGQHKTGNNSKSEILGGFLRLPSYIGEGSVQVYLVMGLGAYRFDPSGGKSSTTVGGSLGPGVSFGLRNTSLAVDVEARFHSTFDQLPRINSQQFISAIVGLELRL